MKDMVQTVAHDAYSGQPKGVIAAVILFAAFAFYVWWKEFVKRGRGE